MVYGAPSNSSTGGQHYGAYGLGQDASWFVSLDRATVADSSGPGSASDSWGPVADMAAVESIQNELRERFKAWAPVQHMMDREVAAMIRVGVFEHEPTTSWVRGPVALAGDAAAPIPPILGQGGNKALENAGVLVHCLARHQLDGDITRALRRYEKLCSTRAADLLAYSHQAATAADVTSPLAILARNGILWAIAALNGTLPSDWLWKYDCKAAVEADTT